MCIGIPMKVIEAGEFTALCDGRNGRQEVNTLLTGELKPGDWILNFLGSAREVISEEDALKIDQALDAVEAIMRGDESVDIDRHFADLTRPDRLPGSFDDGDSQP